jgi:hypothetical protein
MSHSPPQHEGPERVEGSGTIKRFEELTKRLIAVPPEELRAALEKERLESRRKPRG